MTDPPRLLDQGADDFELDVLRSASADTAPAASLSATLSAVAQAGGAAATAGTAAGAVTTSKALLANGLFVKSLVALVIVSGAGIGYVLQRDPSTPPPPDTTSVPATTTKESPLPPPTAAQSVEAPPSASAVQTPEPPPREASKRARPAASERPLMEQIASLDRVRGALAARDGALALRELDRHDREFAGGVLGPESTALRIEALLVSGNRTKANALAEQFLRTPGSRAHATHVRSLLGTAPDASNP